MSAARSYIQINGLVKTYGNREVVDGVDLSVRAGEIVGLLGPNGAGKTTTFYINCWSHTGDERIGIF